jgi:hypothetical protein
MSHKTHGERNGPVRSAENILVMTFPFQMILGFEDHNGVASVSSPRYLNGKLKLSSFLKVEIRELAGREYKRKMLIP